MLDYRYELRRGDSVIATGHFSRERAFEVGERITIGGRTGVVRVVEPILGERELVWSFSSRAISRIRPLPRRMRFEPRPNGQLRLTAPA
jgi:hypothetical protein